MHTKRDATPEEAREGLVKHADYYNRCNPGFALEMSEWEQKEKDAVAEGYKAEVCSCGVTYCAFHHWTRCQVEDCPFSNGISMLETFLGDGNKDA